MKRLVLKTTGNLRVAFNVNQIQTVVDEGAGRNAKILLASGVLYEVFATFDDVMEKLDAGEAAVAMERTRTGNAEANFVPAARSVLRNR